MKQKLILILLIIAFVFLNGCSFLMDLIPIGKSKKSSDSGSTKTSTGKPEVLCIYFHYFKAGPQYFDQWWIHGKDPTTIYGPEDWRRDIWIGRAGDYPYIGIYNNVSDAEVVRWHIRLAKAAGISAFIIAMNNWETEGPQTDLMLQVAAEENFKVGFMESHSFLGAASRAILDGRPQPILPQKYVGYHQIMEQLSKTRSIQLPETQSRYIRPVPRSLRNVPADALNTASDRISAMMNRWKAHPAYLRIDGKPIVVIPYMAGDLTAGEFKQLVDLVVSKSGESLYVVGIVPQVYWYFYPDAVPSTGITAEWSETGTDSFTHWTPNGMITASQRTRVKAAQFHVKDSAKWRKDAMIPVMPGFEDDAWRPGDEPAPTSPRNNGKAWKDQLEAAVAARPRFIIIQAWNEWHEGSQIEPSTLYSDPYLYLRILAQELDLPWQPPSLPGQSSVDPLRLPYLAY